MSQGNELSNIIRDLEKMKNSATVFSDEELSDLHGRIIQLPRTDRRQLYVVKEFVPLEEVSDWQQTCPPDKRITDVGTNSEEKIRIAMEINKRVSIWRGEANTIECDAVLRLLYVDTTYGPVCFERFTISGVCRLPVNYIYKSRMIGFDEEIVTLATQAGCRSLVIDLNTIWGRDNIMSEVRKWLEQNYNLVDKIIFCEQDEEHYNRLTEMMPTYFPVFVANIPESKFPVEILLKGSRAIQIYKKAVSDGKHAVQNIRVMLVGQSGVGKTTLLKRLLGQRVKIKKIESTEGIDVHVHRCKIDVDSGQWHCQDEVPPHPNAALLSAMLPLLTGTPEESILQPVQDTSPKSDTSPTTDDVSIYRRQQNVTGVDVTNASEPESEKSDALASTCMDLSLLMLLSGSGPYVLAGILDNATGRLREDAEQT